MANLAALPVANTATLTRSSPSVVTHGLVNLRTRSVRRSFRLGTRQQDVPVVLATKAISGRIYTLSGVPSPDTTVKLFRQADDFYCQRTRTDANGFYVFQRDETDAFEYYVVAYTDALFPQVHGVSDRGKVPE